MTRAVTEMAVTPSNSSALPSRDACRAALLPLTRAACRFGTVTLSSGKVSDFYVDGKQITLAPDGAYWFAAWIVQTVLPRGIVAVGGPSIGANPVAGAVALLSHEAGTPLRGFMVRPAAKEYGLQHRIEGPLRAGDHVAVVEDVVTSGKSLLQAIAAVEDAGAQVVVALALVDREEGGAQALAGAGYDFEAVWTRADLTAAR